MPRVQNAPKRRLKALWIVLSLSKSMLMIAICLSANDNNLLSIFYQLSNYSQKAVQHKRWLLFDFFFKIGPETSPKHEWEPQHNWMWRRETYFFHFHYFTTRIKSDNFSCKSTPKQLCFFTFNCCIRYFQCAKLKCVWFGTKSLDLSLRNRVK